MRACDGLLALLLVMAGAGCGGAEDGGPKGAPVAAVHHEAPPSRAGAEACADCHEAIVESWSRTGMARSVSAIDLAEFRDVDPVPDEPSGYVYHFETSDGGARIVETRPGDPEHRLEAEIAYAIGADDIRSYVAVQGAFEFFGPIEISAPTEDRPRHAALAPGHLAAPDQRFSVPITGECLGCHTDQLPPDVFPLHLHQPDAWEPAGVTCAACHGPVADHVDWQGTDLSGETPEGPDPVVRPQTLSREQSMSICAACHLQGDVRIPLDSRMGPPPPGGDLLDRLAVFVSAQPSQDIGFVSHTERLVQSTCYQESERMTCATCHDPHQHLHGEEQARVRSGCVQCHTPGGEAAGHDCSRPESAAPGDRDCASCHMRVTPVYDVAEVAIHDHFIRRDPGAPSDHQQVRTQGSPTADWRVFGWPGQPAPAYADDPGLWMMAYSFRGHGERALAKAVEDPGPRTERFAAYHHTRASLFERSGDARQAMRAYQWALMLDATLPASTINLALLRGLGGDLDRGIQLLDQVLERHPAAVNALRNRAGLRIQKDDVAGFVADLTRAFELKPDAVVADILAEHFRESGDVESAAEWKRRACSLDPAFR